MWKIYFSLITVQALGNVLASVFIGPLHVMDVVNWVFMALALSGLFSYAFNRSIVAGRFFKIFVPVIVVWDFLYILWWVPNSVGEPVFTLDRVTLLLFFFLVPQYVALYRYGYEPRETEHA